MALGLALLLAAVPPYLAQSPNERTLHDGMEFHYPLPRDGDRIELELLLSTPNGTWTSGVFASETFRAPNSGEAPEGTVVVYERSVAATHAALGPAVLSMNRAVTNAFYTANGTLLGEATDASYDASSSMFREGDRLLSAPRYRWSGEPPKSHPAYWPLRAQDDIPFRYEGGTVLESLPPLFRIVHEDPESDSSGKQPHIASVSVTRPSDQEAALLPLAVQHRGNVLFANALDAQRWGPVGLPDSQTYRHPTGQVVLGYRDWDISVAWNGPLYLEAPIRRWSWLSPDFAAPVGQHLEYHRANGEIILALDLVATRIGRGTEALAVETFRSDWEPHPIPPPLANVSHFERWKEDPTPLAGGISTAQLYRDMMGPEAPASVRAHMQQGALIVSLAGWSGRSTDGSAQTDWIVGILEGDSLWYARVVYAEQVHIQEWCPVGFFTWVRWSMQVYCGPLDGFSMDRRVNPPDVTTAWVRAGAALREAGHEESESLLVLMPHWWTEADDDPWGDSAPQIELGKGSTAFKTWNAAVFARASDNHSVWGSFDWGPYAGGLSYYASSVVEESSFARALPMLTGEHTTPLRRVDPVGPAVGVGGLLVLLAGVGVRLLLWAKAGGGLPLAGALYARIARDDALNHRRREEIAALVAADPGIDLVGIAQRLGWHRTVAFHHANTLVRSGLLRETKVGRIRHYHPPDRDDPGLRLHEAIAHHAEWSALLSAVGRRPGITLTELAGSLGKSKSTVARQARSLAALGLLARRRSGARMAYQLGSHGPAGKRGTGTGP